ncbi:MAG: protein-L-isoaspartate(D-aspartate) O-methyltransferase [Planctomycetota bacterium]|nr:protein-L-isoaspartate(D-aspartate) O-methyltransferase [Planctomycetota bacterium]
MRCWLVLLLSIWLVLPACGDEDAGSAQEPPPTAANETPEADPAPAPATPPKREAPRDPRRAERHALVKNHIEAAGVGDAHVLRAMRAVQRHRFVPERLQRVAYENRPLPIGYDQTISQPYIVASMTEEALIDARSKVLEIGTGSGYQAAVLAEITPHVFSIEIKEPLAERAAQTLKTLGYDSVQVRHADGYYGWPEEAPFDAIVVTAAAPHVPPPLVKQLKPGGRMVIPVGQPFAVQDLVLVEKDTDGKVYTRSLYAVRFVPLTGTRGTKAQGD